MTHFPKILHGLTAREEYGISYLAVVGGCFQVSILSLLPDLFEASTRKKNIRSRQAFSNEYLNGRFQLRDRNQMTNWGPDHV